jgi:hypothetical protein
MTVLMHIKGKSSQSFDSFKTLRDEKNHLVCLISRRRIYGY